MAVVRWDREKSERLKRERGVSFEEILEARFLGVIPSDSKPHQSYFLFELDDYVWAVPFVYDNEGVFLKTIFPSREFTKFWKEERSK